MLEKVLAGVVLAVCLVMLLRMALRPARRYRFDAMWRRLWYRLSGQVRRGMARLRRQPRKLGPEDAARVAAEAIRRAREGGHWEGNVFKPRSFKRPKKPH